MVGQAPSRTSSRFQDVLARRLNENEKLGISTVLLLSSTSIASPVNKKLKPRAETYARVLSQVTIQIFITWTSPDADTKPEGVLNACDVVRIF